MNDVHWSDVKNALKGQIPSHSYRMWIEPLSVTCKNQGEIILGCPNFFSKKRIVDHFADLIQQEFQKQLGNPCQISYEIAKPNGNSAVTAGKGCQLKLPNLSLRSHSGRFLRRDFTFDQFVVGGNNDFAYSASLSLASRKSSAHNSLFLISQTGMGKSHLSQAVGHHIMSEYPSERVYYVTAEDFSNEMVNAFRSNTLEKFKDRYRKQCDVLLLEDVHYLTGKNRTQVELAMTLDSLLEAEKKIIFSSCYLPGDIPKIDAKLCSRLSCGLISKIDPPNFRMRVRILKQKAVGNGASVPDEVIHYLAGELTTDVRQLESGLIGVTAKSSLLGIPIDLDLAKSVVTDIVCKSKTITIDLIKKLICRNYKVSIQDLVSKSRKKHIVQPRQVAMYLSRKYTDQPLQNIGKSFNRYHATAMYAIGAIEKEIRTKGPIGEQVGYLQKKLEQGDY